MNKFAVAAIALLLALGIAGGYWLGVRRTVMASQPIVKTERKVLYYRNPMGLPDTSPVPKKDAMGMDYVPVYEGDEGAGSLSTLVLTPDKVQRLGVRSEAVTMREIVRTVRASGRIEIDETHSFTIAPKFAGWIERLHVNTTGQVITQGQPLFEVYSPELVSARREHDLALQSMDSVGDAEMKADMGRLAEAGATRLHNWDIEGTSSSGGGRTLRYRSAVSGVVLEKNAVEGQRFMPGEALYRIADLSTVWVMADVAEQDLGGIVKGNPAKIFIDAYPDRRFDGRIDFVYPVLNPATRTVQVRIVIANPNGLLKPAMFASVELATVGIQALAIPVSAVIDSGIRRVVLVRSGDGRFEAREVRLGSRGDGYVEVLQGLVEGEQVVTSANFLIDAESNLKAALGNLGSHAEHGAVTSSEAAEAVVKQAIPKDKSAGRQVSRQVSTSQQTVVGHHARGELLAVNADGTVTIAHQAIESLDWPGMTMDFALANAALAQGIASGSTIEFEIVERGKGEWVVTKLRTIGEHSHAEHDH